MQLAALLAAAEEEPPPNLLGINGTFFVEIITFGLLVFVLAKYVLPPINKAMTDRQAAIQAQFEEAEKLKADAAAAEQAHQAELAEARAEAARIREDARAQGVEIVAAHREQAQAEADRITSQAHAQIEVERAQTLASLKAEVGGMATTLAGRIVGESLGDAKKQKVVVDRFLAELEG